MLEEKKVPYRYRDYKKDPLTEAEIRGVLSKLGVPASAVLRKADAANRELGLSGTEGDDVLIAAMASHPTLLQRPIALKGERAVLGRPPERILEILA